MIAIGGTPRLHIAIVAAVITDSSKYISLDSIALTACVDVSCCYRCLYVACMVCVYVGHKRECEV